MTEQLKALVLAAGRGTRLQTETGDLPKVMRLAAGRPLLSYVLDGVSFIAKDDIIIVVGYKKEAVCDFFPGCVFAEQKKQLGTGHAVMSAAPMLEGFDGSVLVCYGDMPLIKKSTYEALWDTHRAQANDCTLLSGAIRERLPYGRIVRDEYGNFMKVVEEKDCTAEELKITELNSGVYVFEARDLLGALSELGNDNAQGEYYLTDVPAILKGQGKKIGVCIRDLGDEIIGVNTLEQLNQVESLLNIRG